MGYGKKSVVAKRPENLSIRERLGISQEDFAMFCDVSKSTLSMIEIGKRNWPMGKLNQYEITSAFFTAEKEQTPVPAPPEPEAGKKSTLTRRLLKLRIEEFKVEKALEKMAFGYQAAASLWRTCGKLREKFTNPESLEAKLLNIWEHQATVKLKKSNPDVQNLLKAKLEGIRTEMQFVEKLVPQTELNQPNG